MFVPSVKAVELMHSYVSKVKAMRYTSEIVNAQNKALNKLIKLYETDNNDDEYFVVYQFILDYSIQRVNSIAHSQV